MFEAEDPLMEWFLMKLNEEVLKKGSSFKDAWVVHYTEDVFKKAYSQWYSKTIQPSQATKEVKTLTDPYEKIDLIYSSMVKIGVEAEEMQQKGGDMVSKILKQKTTEYIPSGEELASVICEETPSISEFCEYAFETPEINLEKERQWPVDPPLVY